MFYELEPEIAGGLGDNMSKKLLVRFDPNRPEKQSSDFLAPISDGNRTVTLASLKNSKVSEYGLVVFTGRAVTSNDVFAKLVDSGKKIDSVDETLADFEAYVEQLRSFNIGNVLELKTNDSLPRGFELKKTDLKVGASKKPNLP